MQPASRKSDLIVTQMGDELLVYDMTTNKAHALNDASARVFELCDGTRAVPQIAEHLATQLSVPLPMTVAIVEKALEQLSHRNLLELPVERVTAERKVSRRQLLRQIATTAVAIPVIVSLTAPMPAAAFSSCRGHLVGGATCTLNSECASCYCDPVTLKCL